LSKSDGDRFVSPIDLRPNCDYKKPMPGSQERFTAQTQRSCSGNGRFVAQYSDKRQACTPAFGRL